MFLFYDKPLPADVQTLLDAVARLDISEYRLFELAYEDWYGKPADPHSLETSFVNYMFRYEIPFWVRRYAARVIELYDRQRLERSLPGLEWVPVTSRSVRKGLHMLIGLIFIVVFLVVVANASAEWLGISGQCYFPPCY